MTTEIAMIGTKEVAAKLKIEPPYLRMMLRKINGKAPGERYELKKLPDLIKAEEKKAEAAKAKAKKS